MPRGGHVDAAAIPELRSVDVPTPETQTLA
jgi:hypothetical protein